MFNIQPAGDQASIKLYTKCRNSMCMHLNRLIDETGVTDHLHKVQEQHEYEYEYEYEYEKL